MQLFCNHLHISIFRLTRWAHSAIVGVLWKSSPEYVKGYDGYRGWMAVLSCRTPILPW
jgi:hypothetical protein